jgi:SpoVK/Ycf46/Vps4 family AAA+-type ATPase
MKEENNLEINAGDQVNKDLENSGLQIKSNIDPILELVQKYKSYIAKTKMQDEVYKWELVKKFKGRPDINAEDFSLEIKSIKFQNLLYAMSIAVTNHIAKDAPEEYRKLFRALFNEYTPLNERVNSFNVESLKLYRSIGGELGHHQDERSIATYLTLHNPEKYTFYKSTFYKEFCKLMGVSPAGKNEKYGHYLDLLNQFIDNYIVPDTELTDTVKSYISEYYDGTNNLLLAQDILYCMLNKSKGEQESDLFPEILEAIESESFQNFISDEEFYFEKAKATFEEFKSFKLSELSVLDRILTNFRKVGKFKDFYQGLNESSEEFKITNLIAELISYCDSNAAFKNELNQYEDKRVLAKASVRQNNWFENLIEFKKTLNYNTLPSSIKNALIYIENPSRGITMLSDNHRVKFLRAFVPEKQFDSESFIDDLLNFFEPYQIVCQNELNYTRALSAILYNYQPVRNLWLDVDEEKDEFNLKAQELANKKNDEMNNHPLNQILYGPPGTGKTFHTINYALSIIEGKTMEELNKEDRKNLVSRYKSYIDNNVLAMTSFHQSYAYEDFIEGIKPIMEGESSNDRVSGTIQYQIVDGIFKQLCTDARSFNQNGFSSNKNYFIDFKLLENKSFHKISLGNTLEESGNTIYDYCKLNNCIAIGWGEDVNYSGVSNRKEIQERYTEAGYQTMQRDFNIDAIERLVLWIKEGDIVFVSHGNHFLKAVGIVESGYEYKSSSKLPFQGYNHFRKVKWLILDAMIPVKQVYYANFSQQSIYTLWNDKIKKDYFSQPKSSINIQNRVLIIDEINRGNVSSIFGELITLIEEDKREGKINQLSAILPYSKKEFTVPSNVHIIGTMNTADRSVEALDTALRRRFSFVEMLPNPQLLKEKEIEGINLKVLLEIINERIEVLVDRDHTIGHAFFINDTTIEELRNTFANKIIPLLQEYFYGDYSKMEMVIGSAFFDKKEVSKVKFAVKSDEFDAEGKVYHIKNISDDTIMSDKDFISAINNLIGIE